MQKGFIAGQGGWYGWEEGEGEWKRKSKCAVHVYENVKVQIKGHWPFFLTTHKTTKIRQRLLSSPPPAARTRAQCHPVSQSPGATG